jgi:hypothetical protein
VHIDFAGGTHTRRGAPGEFFFGGGLGQVDQLLGDVLPLAVVALPDSFGRGLSKQRTRGNQKQQQQGRFLKMSSHVHAILSRVGVERILSQNIFVVANDGWHFTTWSH